MAAHFQKGPHEARQLLKKEIGKRGMVEESY